MSYDLSFIYGPGADPIGPLEFFNYFRGRTHYKVVESQAVYENGDTGVYFIFEYSRDRGSEGEAEHRNMAPVSFNLNYFRSYIFGLEAEPEVAAFIGHFNLQVFDPQIGGMERGEYFRDKFLKGWNLGNEFAVKALLEKERGRPPSLPRENIRRAWNWNYARNSYQKKLGDSIFVPRMWFFDYKGKLLTGVAWTDGIPIAMPYVDLMVMPRQELAPRKWLLFKKPDMAMARQDEAGKLFFSFPLIEEPLPHRLLKYSETPEPIAAFVKSQKKLTDELKPIAMDQILDQELVYKYFR